MADQPEGGSGPFDPLGDVLGPGETPPSDGAEQAGDVSDSFTEVTSKSWLERLMDAVVGVLIGLVLVLATVVGLFWNEGRALRTERSLTEGAGLVVDADPSRVEPANDGR